MSQERLTERLFEILINGDRPAARAFLTEARRAGYTSAQMLTELFWPTYELVERLHRNDQLTALSYRLATRLLRVMVDQAAGTLEMAPRNGRSIFAWCGPSDGDELGAQMAVDLLESRGYAVTFSGGGIAGDEILSQVQDTKPSVLLAFCSAPGDLPQVRGLIDSIREIGACPSLQIAVGGGVFNRAEGLADEIGADLFAPTPQEMYEMLAEVREPRSAAARPAVERRTKRKAA
ncbi:MAG: hypothetical protein IPJ41_05165 [Phycisphaerales bacterium]|nr:hypothetical protein [Phycisphaerales bacterium]